MEITGKDLCAHGESKTDTGVFLAEAQSTPGFLKIPVFSWRTLRLGETFQTNLSDMIYLAKTPGAQGLVNVSVIILAFFVPWREQKNTKTFLSEVQCSPRQERKESLHLNS